MNHRTAGFSPGVAVYLAYSAGITLVVGVLAGAAAFASSALADRLRRIVPFVKRLSGALLVIAGLYIAYYSVYEVRLFEAEGRPEDPLLAAAGRLQCALAGGAHRHGAWPWLVALVVLLITGSVWGWRRHRAAHGRRDT